MNYPKYIAVVNGKVVGGGYDIFTVMKLYPGAEIINTWKEVR